VAEPERRLTAARGCEDGLLELELDDAAWCRVDPLVVAEAGVGVGDTLSVALVRRIEGHASTRHALDAGARHLSRGPRSRHQLEQRLARDVDRVSARRAVERLATLGLVDDERYGRDLAERRLGSGWGPLRIRQDLETAGLSDDLVSATLAQIDPVELAAAEAIACSGRTGARAWRRLVARGFDPETLEGRFHDDAEEY